jgi:putative spermidine/putrescine transport system permease protein
MKAQKDSKILLVITTLVYLFLLGPFLIVIVASFGANETLMFPPKSYSIKWFLKVFEVSMFLDGFKISILLAVVGTAIALALGIPASYALVRYRFKGKGFLQNLCLSPIIVPGLVLGFALLQYLILVLKASALISLFIGHIVLLIPYTVRVISASLINFGRDTEDAAVSLGANRFRAFLKVVLPNISSGIIAACTLSFITSFNNIPISLFLSGPGVTTLPIQMLLYIEYNYDPTIAALSTLLIFFTIGLVQLTERTVGLSNFM